MIPGKVVGVVVGNLETRTRLEMVMEEDRMSTEKIIAGTAV